MKCNLCNKEHENYTSEIRYKSADYKIISIDSICFDCDEKIKTLLGQLDVNDLFSGD